MYVLANWAQDIKTILQMPNPEKNSNIAACTRSQV
jgi:hypothetical protein